MAKRRGFTLIELLVVVSIIALLIAILLPSLSNARRYTKRVLCLTQARQITTGAFVYAQDFRDYLPYRGEKVHYPHHFAHTSGPADQRFNLNETFIATYLSDRDKIMFCPGDLYKVRYPGLMNPDYVTIRTSYSYYNFPTVGTWLVDEPNLAKANHFPKGNYALFSCLTLNVHAPYQGWFGHDTPITEEHGEGMNATFTDGSGRWVFWEYGREEIEPFFKAANGKQTYYWPIPTR